MTDQKPDSALHDSGPHNEASSQAVRARWLEDHRAAMDAWNAYVDAHGLPLAEYRLF